MKKIQIDYKLYDILMDAMESCRTTIKKEMRGADAAKKEYYLNSYESLKPIWNLLLDRVNGTFFTESNSSADIEIENK